MTSAAALRLLLPVLLAAGCAAAMPPPTLYVLQAAPVAVPAGGEKRLEQALLEDYEITTITRPFLERYAEISAAGELKELLREDHRGAGEAG